jgi:hypothetical protein
MRLIFGLIAIVALAGLHIAALFALLHPKVSREYPRILCGKGKYGLACSTLSFDDWGRH